MHASPELPTPEEQKEIDKMTELHVDDWIEQKHIHEVPIITEGLGDEQ